MDDVVQANAAQTEQLSSTAQSLTSEAEQLRALVARFRLAEGEDGPPPTPRRNSRAIAAVVSQPRPAW